ESGAGIALRIEIDHQYAMTDSRQCGCEIYCCSRLADTALLIGERDNAGAARSRDGARLGLKPGEAHGHLVGSKEPPPAGRTGSVRPTRSLSSLCGQGSIPR